MLNINFIIILAVITLNVCLAQDKWTWPKTKTNQKVRGYYPLADKRVYYTEDQYARVDRDREPTTKRPLPGQPQNDDIDDYPDANDEPNKQNSPYLPNGAVGNPRFGGNFNGFGNYPQIGGGFPGNTPNGILVGPGGPTGIIGRPQGQYPAGVAPSPYPGPQAGYPGYPVTQHFPGAAVNSNPGFPGYNGLNNGLGQYPAQYPGQYPEQPSYANPNNPQQFSGAQYPQTQFPGVQYPQQPQYTEGYGLANLNPGFNANPGFNVNPQFNGNFNPNYGFGYDEYPAQAEGKSARVKAIDKKVDDKVAKNLKKS